ncbi:MAG: hypothetical protein P1V18_04210 [Candidatus Gracilibacteria bacterium]|nr:hypothetical protein [Candidatus Gracilibacteria bacterium]
MKPSPSFQQQQEEIHAYIISGAMNCPWARDAAKNDQIYYVRQPQTESLDDIKRASEKVSRFIDGIRGKTAMLFVSHSEPETVDEGDDLAIHLHLVLECFIQIYREGISVHEFYNLMDFLIPQLQSKKNKQGPLYRYICKVLHQHQTSNKDMFVVSLDPGYPTDHVRYLPHAVLNCTRPPEVLIAQKNEKRMDAVYKKMLKLHDVQYDPMLFRLPQQPQPSLPFAENMTIEQQLHLLEMIKEMKGINNAS